MYETGLQQEVLEAGTEYSNDEGNAFLHEFSLDFCSETDAKANEAVTDDEDNKNNNNNKGDDDSLSENTTIASGSSIIVSYNSRKPRWWRQRSGKATKAQRRAQQAMQESRLERPLVYGEFIDWSLVFRRSTCIKEEETEVWLEIGFGQGDNLLCLSQLYPTTKCFVGAEVHPSAVGIALQRIQESLQRREPWKGYKDYEPQLDPSSPVYTNGNISKSETNKSTATVEMIESTDADDGLSSKNSTPFSNLRIYGGDGIHLLPYIRPASLAAVLITFPDPFAKDREKHWRVIQVDTIHAIRESLRDGGCLFLATDDSVFYEWAHAVVDQFNSNNNNINSHDDCSSRRTFQLVDPCPDRQSWLPVISKYEQKGWDEGRHTLLRCWKAA